MTLDDKSVPDDGGQFFEDLFYTKVGVGRPIIALHGFGATSYSWRYVVSALKHENSFFLFDLRGHGKSKISDGRSFKLTDQAKTISNFVKESEIDSVSLLGHSMGGAIALLTAKELIRNGRSVHSIILVDSVGLPQSLPWFFKVARNSILTHLATLIISPKMIVRLILYLAYFCPSKISKAAVDEYAKNFDRSDNPDALIQTAQQMIPDDLIEQVSMLMTLTVPALVISGKNDNIVPSAVAIGLNMALKNSRLELIENCGHLPHEECYERVTLLLHEFFHPLAKTSGG